MLRVHLRSKLFLLLLVVIIPFFLLQFESIVSRYQQAVQAELNSSYEFAEAISAAFMLYFQYLWDFEQSVGKALLKDGRPVSPGEMEEYILSLAPYHPTINAIGWINPDGILTASTIHKNQGISLADREYFQQVIDGAEKVVSDVIVNRLNGDITIVVARAIYGENSLVGVLFSCLNIDNLNLVVPMKRQESSGSFGLIDSSGMVVYRYGSPNLSLAEREVTSFAQGLPALRGETVLLKKYWATVANQERMGAFVPVKEIGWATFASASVDEVLAHARERARRDIIVLILIVAISLVAAFIVGNHFLQPIHALQHAAISIASGDLHARTRIVGSDELAMTGQIFDQMAERIQELEEGRNRFLQTAAHELRNPMAGIKGILALITRRAEAGKPQTEIKPMYVIMEREIDRLSILLNQILTAFRSQRESTLPNFQFEQINFCEVIEVALLPVQSTSQDHQFVFEYPEDCPVWVKGDFSRLEDVVRNLFSNAIKYSPNGGEIHVSICVEESEILLAVKDPGIGIPKGQLDTIFECFYRASNLVQQDPGGMGLGLYICREIIRKHDGSIWAESEEGQGSTFYIRLPLDSTTSK